MAGELGRVSAAHVEAGRLDQGQKPESTIEKHSLSIEGHRTSISLERIFWDQMRELARQHNRSLASLVSEIDSARGEANLSSAIRVFVLRSALSK